MMLQLKKSNPKFTGLLKQQLIHFSQGLESLGWMYDVLVFLSTYFLSTKEACLFVFPLITWFSCTSTLCIVSQVQMPAADAVEVERRGEWAALCRWAIGDFSKVKARALWSRYFDVGGYDCRLLVYPKGDSQALPGYLSIYLQVRVCFPRSLAQFVVFVMCAFKEKTRMIPTK